MNVPVIGMGVVSAAGVGLDAFAEQLRSGRSALAPLKHATLGDGPWSGGLVPGLQGDPFAPERVLDLARCAAAEALERAGGWGDVPARRRALVVGTTCGGVHALEALAALDGAGRELPDALLEAMRFDHVVDVLAEALGISGPTMAVTVACASGAQAIGLGADLIRQGRADAVLAGGVDTLSRFILEGFSALRALGALPYRVFDPSSQGVVLSEGAGFVVLAACARGAHPGRVLGHCSANDGFAIGRPDPQGMGLSRAARGAIEEAGLAPAQVRAVQVHGTGTRGGDAAEVQALKRVFGQELGGLPLAAIKPLVGHSSGAAGAMGVIAGLLATSEGWVSGGPEAAAPVSSLDVVRGGLRRVSPGPTLCLAAGFGGNDAGVLVGPPEAETVKARSATGTVWVTGAGGALSDLSAWPPPVLSAQDRGDATRGEPVPLDFFCVSGFIPSKESRRLDGFAQLVVLGVQRALADSGLSVVDRRVALGVGSAFSCLDSSQRYVVGLGRRRVNPVDFQNTVSNAALGYAAMMMDLRGQSVMLSAGALSGFTAVAWGAQLVAGGKAPVAVVGGAELHCSWSRLLCERRGERASDGAGFLVLETPESAIARGRAPLAVLSGWGLNAASGIDLEGASMDARLPLEMHEALSAVKAGAVQPGRRSERRVSVIERGRRQAWLRFEPPPG